MKISYLVTCGKEVRTLENLLKTLIKFKNEEDEIVVIHDNGWNKELLSNIDGQEYINENGDPGNEYWIDQNPRKIIYDVLDEYKKFFKNKTYYEHNLNHDYGSHKNYGNSLCSGEFIFQLDADELPSENLIGYNLKLIIQSNPTIELIYVPRINDFRGVYDKMAAPWGWRLTPSTTIVHEKEIDTDSDEYKFLKSNGYILEEKTI